MVVLSQENWAGQGKQSKYWVKTCLQIETFKKENIKDSLLVCEISNLTGKPQSQTLLETKCYLCYRGDTKTSLL